jgi:hypothetical protein
MGEDRFAGSSKTQVRGQRDFTSSSAGPSLDLGNGYLRHVPEPLANRLRKTKAAGMGHRFGSGSDPGQTGMGYEEIRKCALQDHNPDALIGLKLLAEFVKFLRQNLIKKIYRRVIDADECDSRIKPEPETLVTGIPHGRGSISLSVPDGRHGFLALCASQRCRRGQYTAGSGSGQHAPARNRIFFAAHGALSVVYLAAQGSLRR